MNYHLASSNSSESPTLLLGFKEQQIAKQQADRNFKKNLNVYLNSQL